MMKLIMNDVPILYPMTFIPVGKKVDTQQDGIAVIAAGTSFRMVGTTARDVVLQVVTKGHKNKGEQICVQPSIFDLCFTSIDVDKVEVD
jgi:hypothetical protein